VTDYGLPSFLCGQDFQESEADQYKRKKARILSHLFLLNLLEKGYLKKHNERKNYFLLYRHTLVELITLSWTAEIGS